MTEHQCHHRHGDGRLCGSPRLPNRNFCYHHTRLHESYILPGTRYYNPPPLTDLHNVQLALTHVWSALSKGLITHKIACSMTYNIQLAKQTIKDIANLQREEKKCGTDLPVGERCGTDSPVCERGEAAPLFTAEELMAMENDLAAGTSDTVSNNVILSEDARPSEGPLDSSPSPKRSGPRYDKANPPLCLEPALRPIFSRAPDPASTATFIPISQKEYDWMDNYRHLGPSDFTPDLIQTRRDLQCQLANNPTPTPDQIAQALLEVQQAKERRIQEREDAIRMIRAKKRDERNRELLGF